ncbi:hypothetical protein QQ008_07495 [Fulvivirgaceae bacterium BMA10]|uniref:DUF3899 domain-containing protein n=1 Tax=Splendidivirga corallicola TaxID=3051826 RepID=A0ABT8KKF8_9BACT|nr:hypothetical protein [Fulvivirgaceae bacterium BMA10]
MSESQRKHLEFIQNVITRMNANSFLIKGWTITLVSALFALAAKDANINYVLISYIVFPVFWILDGFYLSQERQYRALYDEVRNKKDEDINFSMNAKKFDNGNRTWIKGVFSKTLNPFYGVSIATTLIIMFLFSRYG